MKSITMCENYNINSDGMIRILTSQNYYDYLTSVTDELNSSKIIFLKEDNNFIYMKLSNNLNLDLPDFLKIFSSFNKSQVIESYKINKKSKIITINITSDILTKGNCQCECLLTLNDINTNKTSTVFTLSCDCKLPLIAKNVEDAICTQTFEKNKIKIKNIAKYINSLEKKIDF
jgi:hypothetical protein